jgi:hypothetical protein
VSAAKVPPVERSSPSCSLLTVCVPACDPARCVEVPGDCGSGAGKPCCYSGYNMVTDKPLPSAAWGGDACGDGKAKLYCTGAWRGGAGQAARNRAAPNASWCLLLSVCASALSSRQLLAAVE